MTARRRRDRARTRPAAAPPSAPGDPAAAPGDPTAPEDPPSIPGWVASEIAQELPRLGLLTLALDARPQRSPREIRMWLRDLSSRYRGAEAIALRSAAIPSAYRILYRHIGLDPDVTRIPIEAAVVERLLRGEFRSRNLLDDALLIALIETGVAVFALDAAAVDGPLGLRQSAAGERLGRSADAPRLPTGRLVVADARDPVAVLFGELAREHGVSRDTRRIILFAPHVPGVPAIHVEEALWRCHSLLSEP